MSIFTAAILSSKSIELYNIMEKNKKGSQQFSLGPPSS